MARYDYTVLLKTGYEKSALTLAEAKREAKEHPDEQPYIDQYDLDAGELSGIYWTLEGDKFVKHR